MARALIVGCGCRGRELGRELLAEGWQVRGTSRRAEGLEAELCVPRGAVAATAQRILAELPVADIAIEDTPIEAVIGQFMTAGVAPA